MARNQEKAQSMLNRWTNFRIGNEFTEKKRPPHPSLSKTLKASEHWRRQVLKEISEKVTIIQNASLGEFRIRDLNDEINRLIKEKIEWEKRIVELGGTDYTKQELHLYDENGQVIDLGSNSINGNIIGYKYFGAARELPGVKELFEKQKITENLMKKTNKLNEMYKGIDSFYFGYDEDYTNIDNNEMIKMERENEKLKRIDFYNNYLNNINFYKNKKGMEGLQNVTKELQKSQNINQFLNENEKKEFNPYIKVPTNELIEQLLVQKRKEDLLKQLNQM
ncbi:hypothetical protein ABK040_012099 [Willaertia magna]